MESVLELVKKVVKEMESGSPHLKTERLGACMVLQWQEGLSTLNFSSGTIELVVLPMVHCGTEGLF